MTTAALQPSLATITPLFPQSGTSPARIAARREALVALDSFVRPLLSRHLRMPLAPTPPLVELTIYDEVLRRTSAGGHWTVTNRWVGFVGHTIGQYTVTLHFDEQDRPSCFVINGAREVRTADATPESLVRGLQQATRNGPLVTWAPNFVPDISL